ncbi:MAG: protein kinase [Actinobacteria bacterium]|nr:protein kinase [Actinomycetota bacterium]
MPELTSGELLGGCRVEGVIARGGMGIVYRAVQLDLQRPVALKVITSDRAGDPEFRERFARESRMAAAIDHPNVVPVYAAGEDRGALYIVMRYVPGRDLHALIKDAGPLPAARAAAIVAQVAAALDVAHAAGLVHRDVKPANVLLAAGSGDHAYLSDFGLMRTLDPLEPLTDSGSWIGTVDFASPEQLAGERVDARSDVYSLGCVLYASLTGLPPFARETVPATLLAHMRDPVPRPSTKGADQLFDRVVARALAKEPDDRYPSAGDLGRAALAAARGAPVTETERTVAIGSAAPGGVEAREVTAPTSIAPPRAVRSDPPPPPPPAPQRLWSSEPPPHAIPPRSPAAPGTRARTVRNAPPPAPVPAPPPAARPADAADGNTKRKRRRRPRRAALFAALALPLAGIITVALLMLGGNEREAAIAPTRPLDEGEVRAVARAFAEAYETENGQALGRLLTSDVRRVLPAGTVRGRQAVVALYEAQFRQNATESYELEDLEVTGGPAGRASGQYRVRRAGSSIEGKIVLGVVRDRGRTRIALIAITPRS